MSKEITVNSAADIVISEYGTNANFNRGTKSARVYYTFTGNKIMFTVLYYDTKHNDGKTACDFASHCRTAKGVTQKVKQFLNIK